MIDVHMILLGDENTEWLAQMIQSLADEPIALHIVRGEFGHIGKWRAEGFRRGTNPYVAYVDPDDYVIPGAFAQCIAALEADATIDAAWAASVRHGDEAQTPLRGDLHHMCVYRRRFTEQHLMSVAAEPVVPERQLEPLAVSRGVGCAGYVYRDRPDSPAKKLLAEFNRPRGVFAPLEDL